jgi:hypothetical protein
VNTSVESSALPGASWVPVLAESLWERRVRRDRPRALPQSRSPIALHAALPQQRAPSLLAGFLPQQPALSVLAESLWERRVRRDRPCAMPQSRSPIALHAALPQKPAASTLAANLWERRVRRDASPSHRRSHHGRAVIEHRTTP